MHLLPSPQAVRLHSSERQHQAAAQARVAALASALKWERRAAEAGRRARAARAALQ